MRCFRTPVAFALALGLCASLIPRLAAADPEPAEVPSVGSMDQPGTLPNGFRYAILRLRGGEPGRISLRLIVHAGSLDEHDDERGYAHFIEHMAFNGSRRYPPGTLVRTFQRLGLDFGADLNAETSFTHTTYKLDLPVGRAEALGEALQVLGDFAAGIAFDPAEVRRERGVVLSELTARDNSGTQAGAKLFSMLYSGTTIPERLPIGIPEVIRHAEADGLRQFYERCYRPERMTLVVVGDIMRDPLEAMVTEEFGRLGARGPGAEQVLPSLPAARGLQTQVATSKSWSSALVSLNAVEPRGPETSATSERTLTHELVITALNRRLIMHQKNLTGSVSQVEAKVEREIDDRFIRYRLEASADCADWRAALGLLENELRRAREEGFETAEIRELVADRLAKRTADSPIKPPVGEANRPAAKRQFQVVAFANHFAVEFAANREWHYHKQTVPEEVLLAGFTAEAATAALREMFPDDRLHVIVLTDKEPKGGNEAVRAAYLASTTQPLAATAPRTASELQFRYGDFGPTGSIAERKSEADLGMEMIRFANGIRLNFRPSTTEPGRFRLHARLGRGTADLERNQSGMTLLAFALLSRCDLGRHTSDEISRLTQSHAIEGNWSFNNNDVTFQLTGPTSELPFALQMVAASVSDVKLDETRFAEAVSRYSTLVGSMINSTGGYAKVETPYRLASEDPRLRIPQQAEIAHYTFATVSSWMRTRWLEGPLEIGLVGDFESETAINSAAASLGTLPLRQEPPAAGGPLVYLAKSGRFLARTNLPDKSSAVCLSWPIRGAASLRDYRALQIAAAGLNDRLRDRLREELGETYAPQTSVQRDAAQPDFGFVSIGLTFAPTKAQRLASRAMHLAQQLGRTGLTQEAFARLREPLRTAALADVRNNAWWLTNVLLRAQTQPGVREEARTHGTAFDDISRDEVNAAAARVLGKEPNRVTCAPSPSDKAGKK